MSSTGRWISARQSGQATPARYTPFEVERTSCVTGRVRSIGGGHRDEIQYELTNAADED
jgi:hypothetical protein